MRDYELIKSEIAEEQGELRSAEVVNKATGISRSSQNFP